MLSDQKLEKLREWTKSIVEYRDLYVALTELQRRRVADAVALNWDAVHAAAEALDRVRGDLGRDRISDAFGGTYRAHEYTTLADLVRLHAAATRVRQAVWDAVFDAHRTKLDLLGIEALRRYVRAVFAVHNLFVELAKTGVCVYRPDREICGVTDTIQVTGLLWAAGKATEQRLVSAHQAKLFADGALLEVVLMDTKDDLQQHNRT